MGSWRVSGRQQGLFWHRGCRSRLGSEEEKLAALFGTCCVEISNGDATQAGELSKGEIWRRPLDSPDVLLRDPRLHLQGWVQTQARRTSLYRERLEEASTGQRSHWERRRFRQEGPAVRPLEVKERTWWDTPACPEV